MHAMLVWAQGTQEVGQRLGDLVQYVTGVGVIALIVFAFNIRERLVRIETDMGWLFRELGVDRDPRGKHRRRSNDYEGGSQ